MRGKIAAAAVLAVLLMVFALPAQAAPGATITRGEEGGIECGQDLFGFALTTNFIDVATPGGVETLICYFSDIGYPTLKAETATGFGCSTVLGFTTDSSLVVTPSGQGTLVCRVKTS
jgi:hypothetical protein